MPIASSRPLSSLVLAFLICLSFALPPDQAMPEVAALLADLKLADELNERNRHEEAYRLYLNLLRAWPEDAEVNLGLARTAFLSGHYNHSRMAYERLIATAPENAVLRLELARLYISMGKHTEAKQEIETARHIDPAVSEGDLGKIAATLESRAANWILHGRLAGGLLYDSNYTLAPGLRTVSLGGLPFELDPSSAKQESLGSYLHATLDAVWRPDPASPWSPVGDVSGYQRWYDESSPRRDLTFGRAAAGVRYTGASFLAELRGKTELLLQNEKSSVSVYGGESTFIYGPRPDLHLSLRGGLERRDDHGAYGRSGAYGWGAPGVRLFFGEAGHSAMLSVKGYASDTEVSRYSMRGLEPTLGVSFNLPWRSELAASLAWHTEDYKGPATTLDSSGRLDEQWRAAVFVTHNFKDNLRLEAGWQYTDNHSNSDLYTYNQHLVVLGLAYAF